MTDSPPVIELEGLTVRFGRLEALKALDGRFDGRAIGLLGPNGSGKTTLIHTLLGFHAPAAGTAKLLGRDVRRHDRAARALVGYMPERDAFIAGMTAVRFLRMMGELAGLPPRAALERAHESLWTVGLGEARYRPLESYSLGMKQRAKLAQALVHGPRVLFLDEPTNGLDPPARERMIRLIQRIRDSGEVHLILSSHLLRDVEECCEEVLILKEGRIARYCNLEEERLANRKFLEVEISGSADAWLAAVRGRGIDCVVDRRGRIKLVLPRETEILDLYRIANETSTRIRHLDYKRDSLQDIFLKAMEPEREESA